MYNLLNSFIYKYNYFYYCYEHYKSINKCCMGKFSINCERKKYNKPNLTKYDKIINPYIIIRN